MFWCSWTCKRAISYLHNGVRVGHVATNPTNQLTNCCYVAHPRVIEFVDNIHVAIVFCTCVTLHAHVGCYMATYLPWTMWWC